MLQVGFGQIGGGVGAPLDACFRWGLGFRQRGKGAPARLGFGRRGGSIRCAPLLTLHRNICCSPLHLLCQPVGHILPSSSPLPFPFLPPISPISSNGSCLSPFPPSISYPASNHPSLPPSLPPICLSFLLQRWEAVCHRF